jgi:glycerol-3-phosphate acyltransferase PlsY
LALTAESGSLALIVVGAYFIGCFATGYYLVRWRSGDDIRAIGSGGTGARNVGRILARKWAFATVLGDAGKGMLAVFLAGLIEPVPVATMAAMIAATIGHVWPVQLGFRGGKGVATSLGGLLVWSPFLYAVNAVCFGLGYAVWRSATLAIATCYILLPIVHTAGGGNMIEVAGLTVMSTLIIFLHRDNIRSALQARQGSNSKRGCSWPPTSR